MTEKPTDVVGIVGTGRMGRAIGARLLDAGHRVVVHNRTRERADDLVAAGAEWAPDPAQVAEACDVVLSLLFDEAAVLDMYLGPRGLLSGDLARVPLFVEMSTVRTATTLDVRDRAAARGAGLVDAPVAGGPAVATAGRLLVLAGGTEDDVAHVARVLEPVARRVVRLGPTGSGATMKLVLMHSMGVYFSGLSESLAVGSQLGLDVAEMLDVILDSHGAPPVLQDRAGQLVAEIREGAGGVGFPVRGVRKDLEAVVSTATDLGVPASAAATALARFSAAAGAGYADRDLISIVAYLVEQAIATAPTPVLAERFRAGPR